MSLEAIIGIVGGIFGGVFSGAVAAHYQAKGQIEAVRVGVQGQIDQLKLERDFALQDKEQEASVAERHAEKEQREGVRLASLELAGALRRPDAMNRNVGKAQQNVREAAARVPPESPLHPLADRLVQASEHKDLDAAQAVVSQVSSTN